MMFARLYGLPMARKPSARSFIMLTFQRVAKCFRAGSPFRRAGALMMMLSRRANRLFACRIKVERQKDVPN